MTQGALAFEDHNPLLELLDQQFSEDELESIGRDAHELPWEVWESALYGPLRDFLGRPGKEFRGRLTLAAWELGGQKVPAPPELPLLVEILHAGSLIIDDIEDGSAYRRGEPALHVRFGVPLALNAGNWLYFWPQALIERMQVSPGIELDLHRLFNRTLLRSHQGQALDLALRVGQLGQRHVPALVATTTRLKTGTLMRFAAELGARAAGASSEALHAIGEFGERLGIGLQMLDDLSGIVSERRCHKGHEDLLLGRATWPWAWAARKLDPLEFAKLLARGREVERGDLHPEHLAEELRELCAAEGCSRVHGHLYGSLNELGERIGQSPVIGLIKQDLERLEKSYG